MSEERFPEGPIGSLIASQTGGGTPARQNPTYWTGPIPWASVKDFAEGQIVLQSTQEQISIQGLQASASNLIPANTPIVCTRMAVGRAAVAPMDVAINQDLKALFPARGVVTSYLLRLADYAKPKAEAVSVGSTVKGIKVADYLSIEVPLAPTTHQSKIAEILDTLDAAIQGTEAVVAKLKAMKQGLLHDLLTRGIDANGDLRPPQPEAPHLYKQTPLGWLPKEWDVGKVSDQFDIQLGKMLDTQKNRGATKTYLGNKAIQWDKIDLTEAQTVRMSLSDLVKFRLQPGDLLLCEGGEVGRCAIWSGELEECYYQKALHRLRPTRGYSSRLLVELMRWYVEGDLLNEYVSKTSIAHLTQEKLATVPLLIPPIDEQKQIEDQIIRVRDRIQSEERLLGKFSLQKSGLMDDLLTGRVPVTPLL
tara:strand:+ start:10759 stop:12018 length:1260 start_codon:yes stop_codon:yes gene_type:complete